MDAAGMRAGGRQPAHTPGVPPLLSVLAVLAPVVAPGYTPSLPRRCLPGCTHLPALHVFLQGFLNAPVLFLVSSAHMVQRPLRSCRASMQPIPAKDGLHHVSSTVCIQRDATSSCQDPASCCSHTDPASLGSQRFRTAQLQGAWAVL